MKYPFIQCFNPKRVFNRNTKEWMLVKCGCCEACLSQQSFSRTNLVRSESSQYPFNLFVTLTYDDEHVPLYYVHRTIDCDYIVDSRTGEILDILPPSTITDKHLQFLDRRVRLPYSGCYGYVYRPHVTNFLKLLRKRLKCNYYVSHGTKIKNLFFSEEQVRYYLVSEYGTQTFRPHYHLLFHCSNYEQVAALIHHIPEVWSYGHSRSELSKGDASHYVASYINSTSIMPRYYKTSVLAPFSSHSTRYGYKLFQAEAQKVQPYEFENVIRKDFVSNGKLVSFQAPSSVVSKFFPKCPEYDVNCIESNIERYSVYPQYKEFQVDSLKQLASDIYHGMVNVEPGSYLYQRSESFIYRALLVSKSVLSKYVPLYGSLYRYLETCSLFYKYINYVSLSSFYQACEESNIPPDYYGFCYHNFAFHDKDFFKSKLYYDFHTSYVDSFKRSIKTKNLNSSLVYEL